MLVLTRRIDESITIGSNVTVRVLRVEGRRVRIGINAPQSVPVQRTEVVDDLVRTVLASPSVAALKG